jgi:hypothetical protein
VLWLTPDSCWPTKLFAGGGGGAGWNPSLVQLLLFAGGGGGAGWNPSLVQLLLFGGGGAGWKPSLVLLLSSALCVNAASNSRLKWLCSSLVSLPVKVRYD